MLNILSIVGEVRKNSLSTFSDELLHMDTSVLTDQKKASFINSMYALDAAQRTYQQ